MVQRRDGARLTIEALAELRVGGEMRRQDLDRDGTIQARVAGFVEFAMPPAPIGATIS